MRDIFFSNKIRALRPDQRSFWGFTRIIKDKFRGIPALKLDELTLIAEWEKADTIASKFSLPHDNTLRSEFSTSVRDSCSVLNRNAFNNDPSSYTSTREIKKLKSGKAPGVTVYLTSSPRKFHGEQRFLDLHF
jgi:hypothetical protein